jgi:eukaryotic-like serine/threonine-protein kinase
VHGIAGGLALRGLIGRGPRGAVWRAERRGSPGRVVAVKLIEVGPSSSATDGWSRPDERGVAPLAARVEASMEDRSRDLDHVVSNLQRIAATLRDLAHPHLVQIELVEVVADRIAVVLPYAAGGSLRDVLAAQPEAGLPSAAVADLGACLADALAGCHAAGLRHRAISATNVLLGADGHVLLADVGLSDALQRCASVPAALSGDACREDVRALAGLLTEIVCNHATGPAAALSSILAEATEAVASVSSEDEAHRRCAAAELAARLGAFAVQPPCDADLPEPRRAVIQAALARDRAPSDRQRVSPAPTAVGAVTSPGSLWRRPLWRRPLWRRPLRGRPSRPAARDHVRPASGPSASVPSHRARDTAVHRRPTWRAVAASLAVLMVVAIAGAARHTTAPPSHPRQPDSAIGPATDVPAHLTPGANVPTTSVPATPGSDAAHIEAANPQPSTTRVAPPLCPEHATSTSTLLADGDTQVVNIDLDARDCGVPLTFDGRVLHVPGTAGAVERFEVTGAPRDAVLLAGDWDCNGRDGIALYVPSTGETLRFARLPGAGGEVRAIAEPTGVTEGEASVQVDDRGCAEIVVVPP